MRRFLLDTNHVRHALAVDSPVTLRMVNSRLDGDRFGVCLPVLCEIEAGIPRLEKPQQYRLVLDHALRSWRVWPMDRDTSIIYGGLYDHLRRAGRVLSQADIMIAAIAIQFGLTVLTADMDFNAVPDLRTENWLTG